MSPDSLMERLGAADPAISATPDHDTAEVVLRQVLSTEVSSAAADGELAATVTPGRSFSDRHFGLGLRSTRARVPGQRRLRRAPFAIGTLGLAGAITAATLTLTAATSTPAFALTQNTDGSVTLTINELVGVSGANEELAKLGIGVRVARYEAGCAATGDLIGSPRNLPVQEGGIVQPVGGGRDGPVWRINPSAIPAGDTLSLVATQEALAGGGVKGTFVDELYRGPAPACYPLPQEGSPPHEG